MEPIPYLVSYLHPLYYATGRFSTYFCLISVANREGSRYNVTAAHALKHLWDAYSTRSIKFFR